MKTNKNPLVDSKYLLIFLFIIAVCFFFQNQAVPFFADDYKWIGYWKLKHEGFWQDICQIAQTQWEFCHLENGRLFCHAMVQVLVSWGETVFDFVNTIIFVLTVLSIAWMSFPGTYKNSLFPVVIIIFFLRYLIAEDTTIFYWACGSMNYLLPTGMAAAVIALLNKYKISNVAKWWLPLISIFSILAGWQHEIVVLPIAFALFVYMCVNFRALTVTQWCLIVGYGIGALLVLIAPANFSRIEGPTGMAEGHWIATIIKRLYFVLRFSFVFDILCVVLLIKAFSKRTFLLFIRSNYFWFCALGAVLIMGIILGTSSRMRWGIDLFAFFILLDIINKSETLTRFRRATNIVFGIFAVLIAIHQLLLIGPFFDSWKTYRDAEKQCSASDFPAFVRMEDWHSENLLIEPFVAHPYHMLKEDAFVWLPNCKWVCKSDLYDYMSSMDSAQYEAMPSNGVVVGGEFVMPDNGADLQNIELLLKPMSMSMDADWDYLLQHTLMQKLNPASYPTTTIATEDIVCRVEINNHKFICFDKPFIPVWRDIAESKIIEQ